MRLIKNTGSDRVVDELRRSLVPGAALDLASPSFSLFAFGEMREALSEVHRCRLVLPTDDVGDLSLLGGSSDRAFRNRLQARWLAKQCAEWIAKKVEVKRVPGTIPQATLIADGPNPTDRRVVNGSCSFTTEGLGITPGNQFSLIQCSESPEECTVLGAWFTSLWNGIPSSREARNSLLDRDLFRCSSTSRPPSSIS